MMCYPPSGYIIFSLRELKFYGGRAPNNPNTPENEVSDNEIWISNFSRLCQIMKTFNLIRQSSKHGASVDLAFNESKESRSKVHFFTPINIAFSNQGYNNNVPLVYFYNKNFTCIV